MKTLLLTATLLLITGIARGQGLNREMVDRLKKATVFVRVESEDYFSKAKFNSTGSGFFIGTNGHVITNWHVVRPFGPGAMNLLLPRRHLSLKVYANSGGLDEIVLPATILAVNKEHDLALLATGHQDAVSLAFGDSSQLFETSPLWVAGFPLGDTFGVIERGPAVTIGRGSITALRHDGMGQLRVIQTDAQFDSGNSGGPLIDPSGKLIGVAQSIVVNNRSLNFAIPVAYVEELTKQVALDQSWQQEGTVSFRSTIPEGTLFIDGIPMGQMQDGTLQTRVPMGKRQISLVHPDHPLVTRDLLLQHGTEIELNPTALPYKKITVVGTGKMPPEATEDLSEIQAIEIGKPLLKEQFESRDVLEKMEQSTGGLSVHTWYVRDGQLHQHESSSMLHAIYIGNREWTDYRFSGDVTIKTEENDSRAGLIFRETENGFYLFRIHRETNQAQLAYHSKHPFGWFILGAKPLDIPITDATYRMTVDVVGQNITCRLNDQVIFAVRDQLSSQGRVGFYSVESQAAFGNALVEEAGGGRDYKNSPEFYPMFWYADPFNSNSSWWRLLQSDGKIVRPWLLTDAGAVAVYQDNIERAAMMEKYVMTNFIADLVVRLQPAETAEDALFGFIFSQRLVDGRPAEYRLVLSHQEGTCRLYERIDSRDTLLHESRIVDENQRSDHLLFQSPLTRLILRVDSDEVELIGLRGSLFRHRLQGGMIPAGKLGFLSQATDLILHQLTVSNPQPIGQLTETTAPADE